MNQFIKKMISIYPYYCVYDDDTGENIFFNSFYINYPNKNINDLKFVKICFNMDEEYSVFTIEDKILLYHYCDDSSWSEINYSCKTICGYECVLYSLETSSILPVNVITKLLFGVKKIKDLKKIYVNNSNNNPLNINIDLFKIIITDHYKYNIMKNEETIFEFEDYDGYYRTINDELSLYSYKSNLIFYYSSGDIGGCIVIKKILN